MCAYWVGADPGGKGAFGLAFLDEEGGLRCDTVSSVHQAVTKIEAAGEPLGLGIDAPMWWCAGEGGGRMVDQKLRDHYGISSGTVQAANSLRGGGTDWWCPLSFVGEEEFSRCPHHRVASQGATARL